MCMLRHTARAYYSKNTLTGSDVCAEDSTQWKLPEGAIARLGKGWINDVKYLRDGKVLASGSQDGTVLLWDLATLGLNQ